MDHENEHSNKSFKKIIAEYFTQKWHVIAKPDWLFYTLSHAKESIAVSRKLAKRYVLNDKKINQIHLIIWGYNYFMWIGVTKDINQQFEDLLQPLSIAESDKLAAMKIVKGLLDKKKPKELDGQIAHDAIWSFTGRKRFDYKTPLWRLEKERKHHHPFSESAWTQFLITTLIDHPFLTSQAKDKYGTTRNRHLAKLKSNLHKDEVIAEKNRSGKNLGRGIDTLYRVSFNNHINLSGIADGKANIMISINTILLSVFITLGSSNLSYLINDGSLNWYKQIPLFVLLTTCVASLVFAILSTRPKITEKEPSKIPSVNLLFFGNFIQVSKATFTSYLNELKNDQDELYNDLGKDLYNLGTILKKKYDLLTIAYNIFLVGIIITFITFIILQL